MEECLLFLGNSRVFLPLQNERVERKIRQIYNTMELHVPANSGGLKVRWQNVGTLNSLPLLVKVPDFTNGASHSANCKKCHFLVKKNFMHFHSEHQKDTKNIDKQQRGEKVCTRQNAEQGNHAVSCSWYHLIQKKIEVESIQRQL